MNGIKRLIREEPVLLQGLVQAAIAMLMAFGLGWTAEQVGVVLAFTATLLAVIARAMVTPMATVDATVQSQVAAERQANAGTLSVEEYLSLTELREERDRLARELAEKRRA